MTLSRLLAALLVALFLMDTQGAFDLQSSNDECTVIFALSMMLSSIQIYNLQSPVGGDSLGFLQMFINYGKHFQRQLNGGTAFQDLLFLIRDWPYPHNKPYGRKGGEEFLEEILKEDLDLMEDQNLLRRELRSHFEAIKCFLMPNPGESVRGLRVTSIDKIKTEFIDCVHDLCKLLFDEENLKCKFVNEEEFKCCNYFEYFKRCVELCSEGKTPSVKSWFQMTVENQYNNALGMSVDKYKEMMEKRVNDRKLSDEEMKKAHAESLKTANTAFDGAPKLHNEDIDKKYRDKLNLAIESEFKTFKKNNRRMYRLREFIVEIKNKIVEVKKKIIRNKIAASFSVFVASVFVIIGPVFSVGLCVGAGTFAVLKSSIFPNATPNRVDGQPFFYMDYQSIILCVMLIGCFVYTSYGFLGIIIFAVIPFIIFQMYCQLPRLFG